MSLLLAYTPFLDPMALDRYWYVLIVPMCFFIAVGYRAVRTVDMSKYWAQVMLLTAQLVLGIAGLGILAWVLVRHLLPALAPMPV